MCKLICLGFVIKWSAWRQRKRCFSTQLCHFTQPLDVAGTLRAGFSRKNLRRKGNKILILQKFSFQTLEWNFLQQVFQSARTDSLSIEKLQIILVQKITIRKLQGTLDVYSRWVYTNKQYWRMWPFEDRSANEMQAFPWIPHSLIDHTITPSHLPDWPITLYR